MKEYWDILQNHLETKMHFEDTLKASWKYFRSTSEIRPSGFRCIFIEMAIFAIGWIPNTDKYSYLGPLYCSNSDYILFTLLVLFLTTTAAFPIAFIAYFGIYMNRENVTGASCHLSLV